MSSYSLSPMISALPPLRKVIVVGLFIFLILKQHANSLFRASEQLKKSARAWIDKLSVKNGTYPPDSYPNPGNYSNPDSSAIYWLMYFNDLVTFHSLGLPQCPTSGERVSRGI